MNTTKRSLTANGCRSNSVLPCATITTTAMYGPAALC
jgi:hypothetical protein